MEIEAWQIYELEDRILVDIRSPEEFKDFHIPGAVNLPLFDDYEKRIIGLLYRERGLEEAKEAGYKIAGGKVGRFIERFEQLRRQYKHVVVYCWRGGLRSKELCKVLKSYGIDVYRLIGGYRAYRNYILSDMGRILEDRSLLVLTGKTGVGKTKLIRRLKQEGFPAVDLEHLAQNRGSVFGKMGMDDKLISQKMFDALLYEELRSLQQKLLITEDESRCIGRVHLPQAFWDSKEKGTFVEITADLRTRVKNIIEEYTAKPGWEMQANLSLERIRKYLSTAQYKQAKELLKLGRVEELATLLMVEYYDKRYRLEKKPSYTIDCSDFEGCFEELKLLYLRLFNEGQTLQNCGKPFTPY
ncbi:MAG: tRNA 2-selenouridine(34) synthase MnmH [Acidobacteria bacterium]|jgi:tRNA 2-selenouridine synthase|nr:MAG: tRNA 2-selenouridine(34) synthase MnmH [Acidobacteriota bacterium]